MRFRDRLAILRVQGFPAWFRTAFKDPSKLCNSFWAIIHGWRAAGNRDHSDGNCHCGRQSPVTGPKAIGSESPGHSLSELSSLRL